MLTDSLKQKVLDLWNLFRSAGVSNPLSALEQITYLIGLKRLEQIEAGVSNRRHAPGDWTELIKLKSQTSRLEILISKAMPHLKKSMACGEAFHLAMVDAAFGIRQPKILDEACKLIDQLPLDLA